MTDLCVLDHGLEPNGEPKQAKIEIGLLCKRHRRQLDDHVDEIQHLIVDTRNIVDGGAPQAGGPQGKKPKKRADPPAPGDLTIMAMFDGRTQSIRIPPSIADPLGDQSDPLSNVEAIVAGWVVELADERPLTQTRHKLVIRRNRAIAVSPYTAPMTLPKSLLGQLDLLRRHHDWVAAQGWVEDYLRELTDIRTGLKGGVHDHPIAYRGKCILTVDDPENPGKTVPCGGRCVVENGSTIIKCLACKAQWVTPGEQARWAVGR